MITDAGFRAALAVAERAVSAFERYVSVYEMAVGVKPFPDEEAV